MKKKSESLVKWTPSLIKASTRATVQKKVESTLKLMLTKHKDKLIGKRPPSAPQEEPLTQSADLEQTSNIPDKADILMASLRELHLLGHEHKDFKTMFESFSVIVRENDYLIQRVDKHGYTPMMLAVAFDIPEALKLLLDVSKRIDLRPMQEFVKNPPYENKRCLALIRTIYTAINDQLQAELKHSFKLLDFYSQQHAATLNLLERSLLDKGQSYNELCRIEKELSKGCTDEHKEELLSMRDMKQIVFNSAAHAVTNRKAELAELLKMIRDIKETSNKFTKEQNSLNKMGLLLNNPEPSPQNRSSNRNCM